MAEKIWFITGASRGFGRIWAEAALKRGDKVAATARKLETVAPLSKEFGTSVLPLALDVTDRAAVFAAVKQAHAHFGRLDVIVNNAGYGLFSTIEEASEAEARAQFETNVFGALWVLQAALPLLRAQGSGHILSVSSIGGVIALPILGLYNASKWALEAMNESLAQEVAEFGVKVTLIEPGPFRTEWSGPSAVRIAENPVYDATRKAMASRFTPESRGDPQATAQAILKVVDAEKPPLRLFLGAMPLTLARRAYESRLATWEDWDEVAKSAQGAPA